jgi:hypothetical protein
MCSKINTIFVKIDLFNLIFLVITTILGHKISRTLYFRWYSDALFLVHVFCCSVVLLFCCEYYWSLCTHEANYVIPTSHVSNVSNLSPSSRCATATSSICRFLDIILNDLTTPSSVTQIIHIYDAFTCLH